MGGAPSAAGTVHDPGPRGRGRDGLPKLGRAEDPDFTIKTAVVSAQWDGATTRELQDQVVDPIEKKLHALPYFDYVQTYTTPGFASLIVNLRDDTPAKDVPTLLYQLRKKLDDLKPDLPAGIKGPRVNDEFGDVDSILYAITAPGGDYLQLKFVAEGLRRALERVPGAEKIDTYGYQDQRIWVEFSHAKLPRWAFRRRRSSKVWPSKMPWHPPASSRPAAARVHFA